MLGALVFCSPSKHIFCCSLLTLLCAYVNEWHVLWETSEDPCSVVPWWLHMAYGRNMLLIIPTCQCQEAPDVSFGPSRNGQSMWTELSFFGQTFQSLWPFHNSLEIRSANLICRIIDFQGTCDLCCYCVLWLRSQTWIGSQEAPSLTRNQTFRS